MAEHISSIICCLAHCQPAIALGIDVYVLAFQQELHYLNFSINSGIEQRRRARPISTVNVNIATFE